MEAYLFASTVRDNKVRNNKKTGIQRLKEKTIRYQEKQDGRFASQQAPLTAADVMNTPCLLPAFVGTYFPVHHH